MTVLRWGILGPGRIAPRLVRGIAAEPRGELVAVASRDAERGQAFATTHDIPRVFDSYDGLLADPGVDVVYIALPNHLHVPWTIRALEAGKHVLCEKPFALTAGDVDAVRAAAARTDRIAVEAFMYLHHPQIRRAVELALDGSLGVLRTIHGSFSFPLASEADPRADPAMGGGSIWDVGCYPVSFAHRVAGSERVELAAAATYAGGIDRTFTGQLRFPGDLLVQFDCGFASPDRQRLEVVGADASLVLSAPFLSEPDGPPPSLVRWRDGVADTIDVPSVDQYALEVADLTAAILDGRTPHLTLDQTRAHIATVEALDRLARAGAGVGAGAASAR